MTTRTLPEFEGLNGHPVAGAHSSASGHQVFVTRPHQMPRLSWLKREASAPRQERDRSAGWLRNAMIALGVLSVAAAVVSYAAQYHFVLAAKKVPAIAGLEAGLPDAAAVIFACLGIALALQGKRAVRARVLNVGAVATSIFMNFASASGTGWRDVAIWTMPPVAYALGSDTAIGVVRAWAIARQRALNEALADDEASPLAILGRVVLYALRLVVAPPSTISGARRALLIATPLPERAIPEPVAAIAPPQEPVLIGRDPYDDLFDLWVVGGQIERRPHERAVEDQDEDRREERQDREPREGTKTARFLALVEKTHGPLTGFPLVNVSRVAGELAPEVDLHAGTARKALRAAVVAATDEALGGVA